MTLQTAIEVLRKERAPAYRERQLTHAVYTELAERWDEVSALPKALRERLDATFAHRTWVQGKRTVYFQSMNLVEYLP